MPDLEHLAFVAPAFTTPSPAQHLLDRLLAGFPSEGRFLPGIARKISIFAPGTTTATAELERRSRDLGLHIARDAAEALNGAQAAVVAWPGPGHDADSTLLDATLSSLAPGTRCFVHGLLGRNRIQATRSAGLAHARGIPLAASTVVSTAPRLPDVLLRAGVTLDDALIVVQGPTPAAVLDGVEGLMPDLERAGVSFDLPLIVRAFEGDAVWSAGRRGEWPDDLLAAALSRTNNPQGDPITDGRTQDLHGLGLVPKLAKSPRAWITRHPDGCRTTILALDGVVTDINLALRPRRGGIVSTQLYRPPAPNHAAYHDLAAAVARFLTGGAPAWNIRHPLGAATWHAALLGDPGIETRG